MTTKPFEPTDEQQRVIEHVGSAFIAACPGAGKTRVIVERARKLLNGRPMGRGIAFLSFTIAAVSELEDRLRREGLVETPAFPHFIGTFDAFLWQFLIAPFGIDGCTAKPRLIPDKGDRTIQPFPAAQALPLECFDRATGDAIPAMIQRHGFRGKIKAHETAARNTRARFLERGELDFADARSVALARLRDPACGAVLGPAFSARFQELIVDEAQDCNPVDLEIIAWFRAAGIPVKVISDPNQAIYGFRGGVTRELGLFAETFGEAERLPMNGNFRSSRHITKGVVVLRAPNMRTFHFSFEVGGRKEALVAIHRIMLELGGRMGGKTYHQHLVEGDVAPDAWRPEALALAQALRFTQERFATVEAWHDEARRLLAPLLPAEGQSINQRLRRNAELEKALSVAPATSHPARTIHSVKGMEFPAICVVMSPSTAKGIIDFLAGDTGGDNEEARKIYVGASRAQRLLAIALPRTQAPRLRDLMVGMGGAVELVAL